MIWNLILAPVVGRRTRHLRRARAMVTVVLYKLGALSMGSCRLSSWWVSNAQQPYRNRH